MSNCILSAGPFWYKYPTRAQHSLLHKRSVRVPSLILQCCRLNQNDFWNSEYPTNNRQIEVRLLSDLAVNLNRQNQLGLSNQYEAFIQKVALAVIKFIWYFRGDYQSLTYFILKYSTRPSVSLAAKSTTVRTGSSLFGSALRFPGIACITCCHLKHRAYYLLAAIGNQIQLHKSCCCRNWRFKP